MNPWILAAIAGAAASAKPNAGRRNGFRRATPAEIKAASWWEGVNDPDVPTAELDWFATDAYPLSKAAQLMPKGRADWRQWWRNEKAMRAADYGTASYYQELESTWRRAPRDPIVLIEDTQGHPEGIWDGWHRTAISVVHGSRLPAIVGRRR